MTTLSDVKRAIERLERGQAPTERQRAALNTFLGFAADHPRLTLQALAELVAKHVRTSSASAQSAPGRVGPDTALVEAFLAAYPSDDAFWDLAETILKQRNVSKEALIGVYRALFANARSIPPSATKPRVLQMIRDERNTRVANANMAAYLRGVPAE